jgi:outer membrane protein TolC
VRGQLFPQLNLIGSYKLTKNYLPKSVIPASFSVADMLEATPTGNEEMLAGTLDNLIGRMVPNKVSDEASLVGMLQFQQLLFSGGKLINGIRVLDRIKTMQEKRYEIQLQQTVLTVVESYYDLYQITEALNIQRAALTNAELHLQRVENLHRQGLVSEYDKLRAELEVSRLYPEVLNMENMKNLAEENFKRLTGFTGEIELSPDIDRKTASFSTFGISLDDAITTAHENRTELYLTNLMTEIYQVQLNSERDNYLPNIVLQADITRYNVSNSFNIHRDDFGTMGSVGIAMQVPLFTGMSNTSRHIRSKHELRKSQYENINARELIELEVRQNWQSFNQSLLSLEIAEKHLRLTERALHIAETRFQNQSGIQLEVFDAQIQHNAAQIGLSVAKIKIIKDYYALNKAIGQNLAQKIGEI